MVHHVAHVAQGQRIAAEGRVRTARVEGDGRLRGRGVRGLWVSPNVWANGSIYGNVRFSFDWESVIEGRRLYWVEGVKAVRPRTCRFLLSKRKFDAVNGVRRYDAREERGPVRCI